MRYDTLTRAAAVALLATALWLPTSFAHADDERALAARAYEHVQPTMRELMRKAYVDSASSRELMVVAGCEAVSKQLHAEFLRDTTPVVMELFFDKQTQQRVEGILVDVYDVEQLRIAASGGSPPSTPAQSAKMASKFQELNVEFQQRIAQDGRVTAVMVAAIQRARERLDECRAAQGQG